MRLVPFLYVCLYAAYLLASLILPENVVCVADSIMCVSPLATGGLLAASRIFGFCRWHRIACLLPSASQVEGCVDTYLVTLTQGEVIGINLCIAVGSVIKNVLEMFKITVPEKM